MLPLQQMGLNHARYTLIGSPMNKGISGGWMIRQRTTGSGSPSCTKMCRSFVLAPSVILLAYQQQQPVAAPENTYVA
jgi:hypothetical protein